MFLIKIKNTLTSSNLIKLAIKNSFFISAEIWIHFSFQHDSHWLISSFVFFFLRLFLIDHTTRD